MERINKKRDNDDLHAEIEELESPLKRAERISRRLVNSIISDVLKEIQERERTNEVVIDN